MSTEICPVCGRGTLQQITGMYETSLSDRNGEVRPLEIPGVTWKQCDQCKEIILDDAATQTIEAARRNALGLLSPSEIRNLRLGLNKTQREMSRLLGIGEKTYCRWESGAFVQSTASDRYLRLLIVRPENLEVLEMLEHGADHAPRLQGQRWERTVFTHLEDIERLEEEAEVFIQLLEVGGLHAAAA